MSFMKSLKGLADDFKNLLDDKDKDKDKKQDQPPQQNQTSGRESILRNVYFGYVSDR